MSSLPVYVAGPGFEGRNATNVALFGVDLEQEEHSFPTFLPRFLSKRGEKVGYIRPIFLEFGH